MGSIFQSFQQSKQQGLPLSHRPSPSSDYYNNAVTGRNINKDHEPEQSGRGQLGGGIRRRLSSLSLKMQLQRPSSTVMTMISSYPSSLSPPWAGAFRRSKSVSSSVGMGEYAGSSIRKWWEWGCAWILSRKPTFAKDLEMNEAETAALGCHNKGSWRHVFYKVKSELGKLVGYSDSVALPQTFRYDSKKAAPLTNIY